MSRQVSFVEFWTNLP